MVSAHCPEIPRGPESEAHVTEDPRWKSISRSPSSWMEPPCWVSSSVGHMEDSWDQCWVLPRGHLISCGLQTSLCGPDEPAGPTSSG